MNNEIKRIINDIQECDSLHNNCDYLLEHEESYLLINYINQLQSNWNSLKDLIEKEKTRLAKECSHTYEDSLGKTKLVNEDIFNELNKISDRMNELEGNDKE